MLNAYAAALPRSVTLLRERLQQVAQRRSGLQERGFRGNLAGATFVLRLRDEALELADGRIENPEPHYVRQPSAGPFLLDMQLGAFLERPLVRSAA